ncbi:biotin-dependent carboxyltransferase family protein [Evansella sp. AB-rgal1]|uniref:5-oxoprolinase subunit C family protein n=1 Tax=Evansella sp. AB-rgal1 TaxID=3242696 RepID=UPI00359EF643
MNVFEVLEPGLHTTVQDLGRIGYQKYGIGQSGVMDDYSFQLGNLLLGNDRNAAGLEITMLGPNLRIVKDVVIAITGANLSPAVNGEPVAMWSTLFLHKGDELQFGKPQIGARAYILVAGGIEVSEVMGSRSTNIKGRFGGWEGRALEKEDVIVGSNLTSKFLRKRTLAHDVLPNMSGDDEIRVISGPQEDMFSEEAITAFYQSSFKITTSSDRMGYRLEGEYLHCENQGEMITDAVALGSIQVPGDGNPIVLMADRQTSGGYPKIANVISVDMWKVAQRLPGQALTFKKIELEEAHQELHKREKIFKQLQIAGRMYS